MKDAKLVKVQVQYRDVPQQIYDELDRIEQQLRELAPKMKLPGDIAQWLLLENHLRLTRQSVYFEKVISEEEL